MEQISEVFYHLDDFNVRSEEHYEFLKADVLKSVNKRLDERLSSLTLQPNSYIWGNAGHMLYVWYVLIRTNSGKLELDIFIAPDNQCSLLQDLFRFEAYGWEHYIRPIDILDNETANNIIPFDLMSEPFPSDDGEEIPFDAFEQEGNDTLPF